MNQLKNIYHFFLAWLGAIIYRHPSRKLTVIGITGTKGKSSTVEMVNAIFEAAGKKTAMLSSVYVKMGNTREKNITDTTMPGRFFIQRFLRRAVREGCEYAFLEVTSQGIFQHRHRFIEWDGAAFLNLHPEHIEAHGSFEAYRHTKVSWFEYVSRHSRALSRHSRGSGNLVRQPFFFINSADPSAPEFEGTLEGDENIVEFNREAFVEEWLRGDASALGDWFANDFNMENAACAAAIADAYGIPRETILKALKQFKGLPGRMEWIQREPFGVVIDYAHTPQSLIQVYQTLRSSKFEVRSSRLICVLGSAGGGRDTWKRPEFGKIAGEYCNHIILTDEDPYNENQNQIVSEIQSGITNYQLPITIELNRKEAIEKAVSLAEPGDVVIITGKGSEQWIHVAGGKKIPWSDRDTAKSALAKKK